MGFIERTGNLSTELQDLAERQRPFFKTLGQRFAFDASHDQILDAVLAAYVVKDLIVVS